MRNISLQNVQFIPRWEGNRQAKEEGKEHVVLTLVRLSLTDYWKASALCVALGEITSAAPENLARKLSESETLLKEICLLINTYVVEIKGLQVDDKPAKPPDLIRTAVFLPLILETIMELLFISTLGEDDKKKLNPSLQEEKNKP